MCGIFGYKGNKYSGDQLMKFLLENKHRGPDNTHFKVVKDFYFGFNRLCVNGLDDTSDQPFHLKGCHLICNGEIYNYKDLIKEFDWDSVYTSHSDCEIIIHLYRELGFEGMLKRLDGVFAMMLYDEESETVYIARDPLGIRSLYYSFEDGQIAVASEMKSLVAFNDVGQFPSGHYWSSTVGADCSSTVSADCSSTVGADCSSTVSADCSSAEGKFVEYYHFDYEINHDITEDEVLTGIRTLFTEAVEKRLMSDRKIGCLLSGGLDSTLVTAIVCKKVGAENMNTYSIGLEGSVDLECAQRAADYLGTNHTNIVVTEEQFLSAIEKTIKQIESWDTTSVRASVGNYLVSLYIGENSDDKVIYCGDVSDEMFASYRGFMSADTEESLLRENVIMLKNIRYYDVLRSDKSISGAGLEARVPFGDLKFVNFVMSLPAKYKMFSHEKMEKYYLRKAFDGYLPDDLLWRRKEAFSDGVSSLKRSWFEIIREYVDKQIPDGEFDVRCIPFKSNTPYDKESLFYREIFDKYYHGKDDTIPYYWRHPFSTILDPSARLLDTY